MLIDCYFLILVLYCLSTWAYIPASPTNDTEKAVREGGLPVNQSDISTLSLQWYPSGNFVTNVSYQLAGRGSNGLSRGPLLHFSEFNFNNDTPPTLTPWIALISCDRNATNMSDIIDIFTLARDKGATAAVLYSLEYEACIINPEYADPSTFDQVFDIFSTKSLSDSATIDYQFGQPNGSNRSIYSLYNSSRLNDSVEVVGESIATNTARGPGFLFATLRAYNSTGNETAPPPTNNLPPTADRRSTSTNSAMIVLYSITGCVSALFVAVIVTGAVRAIRHPERYGARAQDMSQGGFMPAHARGLARAVLDTFPIFKFSSTSRPTNPPAGKDLESGSDDTSFRHVQAKSMDVEMADWVAVNAKLQNMDENNGDRNSERDSHRQDELAPAPEAGPSSLVRRETGRTPKPATEEVMPDAIGRETCPICIVDFEEGDDLRMLPCEGKHIFHQQCVDPWLLELSSSCPLCRHDFMALENMLSGEPAHDDGVGWRPQSGVAQDPRHSGANRFSRYLRFARHRRNREQNHGEPTDVPQAI